MRIRIRIRWFAPFALLSASMVTLASAEEFESDDLGQRISARFERVELAHLPTPFEEMKRLTKELGSPPLFIKRDDQTGLAFGGNKARKLEFIFADILKKNADVVITWAGVQSNWARQTAAASRVHGLDPILVLTKGEHSPKHGGNLLLDALMGADVRLIEPGDDRAAIVAEIKKEQEAKGRRPYVMPVGGSLPSDDMEIPLGAIAYANGFEEMYRQAQEAGLAFDHVVLATGSGGTQAGLMVGTKVIDESVRIVGISVSRQKRPAMEQVVTIARQTADAIGLEQAFALEDAIVLDGYIGEAYGVVDGRVARAIATLARAEGIMLDPVYTSKAFAGMLDLIEKGYFDGSRGIVFLHTGGTPALFVYEDELLKNLPK